MIRARVLLKVGSFICAMGAVVPVGVVIVDKKLHVWKNDATGDS